VISAGEYVYLIAHFTKTCGGQSGTVCTVFRVDNYKGTAIFLFQNGYKIADGASSAFSDDIPYK
jgi:hypothetical protein